MINPQVDRNQEPDEISPALDGLIEGEAVKNRGLAATLSRNVALSLGRVLVNSAVALALPAYLTHHLPVATYGAWVLILQIGAYVSFLDFGVQTGVAKFVAEYDARHDELGAGKRASAGLAIMAIAGLAGVCLSVILAWQMPRLFHNMPDSLYKDVQIGVLLVGSSLSFGLVCSVFSAVFIGLQRYSVPMTISILNRLSFTAVVITAVMLHRSLTAMGAAVAIINVVTGLLQILAWRKLASAVRVSIALLDFDVLKEMARYCSLLSIWTVGMLCVSGLDVTIVGHYDFGQTAFYSIATSPTNFVLLIMSAMLGPMMPASSALSTHRSALEMGNILARATRYCAMILLLLGLPLVVCGLPILRLWVGPVYALHTLKYLRILVLANILRNFIAPYATVITAIGKQGVATVAAVAEAVVNLGSSIYLASRFGAIGVAFGTLLGSFVSVSIHFAVTMPFTYESLAISRTRLFVRGLLRPAILAVPTILLLPFWWFSSRMELSIPMTISWGVSTLLIAWFGNLNGEERKSLIRSTRSRLLLPMSSG